MIVANIFGKVISSPREMTSEKAGNYVRFSILCRSNSAYAKGEDLRISCFAFGNYFEVFKKLELKQDDWGFFVGDFSYKRAGNVNYYNLTLSAVYKMPNFDKKQAKEIKEALNPEPIDFIPDYVKKEIKIQNLQDYEEEISKNKDLDF